MGIGEKAGSGADYIVKGWLDNKWGKPRLEEKVQPDVVTLTFELEEVNPNNLSPVCPQSVPSLSPVCPQFVPGLSPVCPKLEQVNEGGAKIVLYSLLADNLSISSLMEKAGEKNKNRFRKGILTPLVEAELIEPTIKDKPTSSKQTYRLTDKAREWMKS